MEKRLTLGAPGRQAMEQVIAINRKYLQENGSISIAGANDSIQRIILISGLHKLVHTCKDVSQAAKNIEK